MTNSDPARVAAVSAVLSHIEAGMTISLGSGQAIFALTHEIGKRFPKNKGIRAVVASAQTGALAEKAGIAVIPLEPQTSLDLAIDGADEIDLELRLIKGRGAALLQEKLVLDRAKKVVIIAQEEKLSTRLGEKQKLPIEIVRFAWETTRDRLLGTVSDLTLRTDEKGNPVITDEGHFILDAHFANEDLYQLAREIKLTLGVVEHGLFLDQANEVILGKIDGTTQTLRKE